MEKTAPQLDYSESPVHRPFYRFVERVAQEGSSVTVTPSAGQVLTFECPASVYNMSRSILSLIMTPNAVASKWHHICISPFSFVTRISVYDNYGVELCNVNYVNNALNNLSMLLKNDVWL